MSNDQYPQQPPQFEPPAYQGSYQPSQYQPGQYQQPQYPTASYPPPAPPAPPKGAGTWIWVAAVVVALVLGFVAGRATATDTPTSPPPTPMTTTPATVPTAAPTPEVMTPVAPTIAPLPNPTIPVPVPQPTGSIGPPVRAGNLEITVRAVDVVTRFDNEIMGTKTGRWVRVAMTLTNVGDEPVMLTSSQFRLITDDAKSYADAEADLIGYTELGTSILFDKVNPGIPINRMIHFDVPEGQTVRELLVQSDLLKPGSSVPVPLR